MINVLSRKGVDLSDFPISCLLLIGSFHLMSPETNQPTTTIISINIRKLIDVFRVYTLTDNILSKLYYSLHAILGHVWVRPVLVEDPAAELIFLLSIKLV